MVKYLSNENLGFKKRLKLIAKNNAFSLVHRLAIRRMKKIVQNSSPIKPKKNGKKIFFNLVYGMYGKLIYWEVGLAKALQVRGHNVKVLTCGKSLTMCTSEYTSRSVHNDKTCKHCIDFSKEFLDLIGIPNINFKDFISIEEFKKIQKKVKKLSIEECKKLIYKDVKVGILSTNSAIRYFEGDLNPEQEKFEKILRLELINGIIVIDIAEKIVKTDKPDVIVTTHMGYSSWGGFVDYCSNHGVRICYSGDGYIENTIEFDIFNSERKENAFRKFFEKRNKKTLNNNEEKEIQKFIDDRIHGREGDTSLYGYENENVKEQFDFKKYKKTFVCYPNVAWDSSLLDANTVFKSVYEWVSKTIELFKDKPDYQLIIKIHPSEAYVAKSKNTVSDYIKSKFDPIPKNVKIIPPVTTISPYSLFPFIDAGIVYNGTIGLEMAVQGVPVIVSGVAHYGKKGFTYDVSSKKEYEDILFKKLKPPTKKQINLGRTYAYFYFLKSFVPYNLFYKNSFWDMGWNINSFDEMAEGNDKFLDIICKYIAYNGIYQNW